MRCFLLLSRRHLSRRRSSTRHGQSAHADDQQHWTDRLYSIDISQRICMSGRNNAITFHLQLVGFYKGMLTPIITVGFMNSALFFGYGATLHLLHPNDSNISKRKDLPMSEVIRLLWFTNNSLFRFSLHQSLVHLHNGYLQCQQK